MIPRIEELRDRFTQERLVKWGVKNLNLVLVDIGHKYVRLSFTAPADFCVEGNNALVLQGGVLDVAIDFAGVYAAMTATSEHAYWETNLTNYSNPIRAGEHVTVSANIKYEIRREIWVDVEVHGDNGELKAHSKLKYIKPKPKSLY